MGYFALRCSISLNSFSTRSFESLIDGVGVADGVGVGATCFSTRSFESLIDGRPGAGSV